MSTRELSDFLKAGDKAMQAPMRRSPVCPIGKGFPEMKPPPESGCGDPQSLRDEAVRGWLKAVELGLIGGADELLRPLEGGGTPCLPP